jgi:hypothetical protein
MKEQKCLVLFCMFLFIMSIAQIHASKDTKITSGSEETSKKFDVSQYHNSTSMWLRVSNYGYIGSGDNAVPQYPSLEYPGGSGIDYLYQGAIWFGAKKYRRNAAGHQLFWLAQHPSADSSGVVADGDPGWNDHLKPVVDTLTTIGFDGDKDLYEFLPAYNPLESGNSAIQDLYAQYNSLDKVMKSILSNPSPRPFEIPDPTGTYCYSIPTGQTGNESGFETLSGYYYDYSPFGTPGERDWGTDRSTNSHVPLKIAVEQKSYTFPLQNYDKIIVVKYTMYNSSAVDTLFDVNMGCYMDYDCNSNTGGSAGDNDDVSGYIKGGYEFAYSRDADGDEGLTPAWIGTKLILPDLNLNRSAWYWQVGDGPNDFNPLSLNFAPHLTANEKFWLMTGRNPNTVKYLQLRGGPNGNLEEFEQPTPCDTRFMASYYGNQPTSVNPNPYGRLHLSPLSQITFYMAIFAGENLSDLKQKSVVIDSLISSNFDLGNMQGLTSIPYLIDVQQTSAGTVMLNWASYTDPGSFEVMYKSSEAPDSLWQSYFVLGSIDNYTVSGLTDGQAYQFRIASLFNPGPDEICLISNTVEYEIDDASSNEDLIEPPLSTLNNYPNPFQSFTRISFVLQHKSKVKLTIYNIKGQAVKTLIDAKKESGKHEFVWNGRDSQNKSLASGIYYCIISSDKQVVSRKMLMLK